MRSELRSRSLVGACILLTSITASITEENADEKRMRSAEATVPLRADESITPRVWDRAFLRETLILSAATIYDVETTFAGLGRCPNCEEKNPIARRFVSAGRVETYAFAFAVDTSFLYLAHRLKTSEYPDNRTRWRRPIRILAALHLSAGTLNLRFVF